MQDKQYGGVGFINIIFSRLSSRLRLRGRWGFRELGEITQLPAEAPVRRLLPAADAGADGTTERATLRRPASLPLRAVMVCYVLSCDCATSTLYHRLQVREVRRHPREPRGAACRGPRTSPAVAAA